MVTPNERDNEALPLIFLDACCLLNLAASRQITAILRDSHARFAITTKVATESGYLRRGGTGDDADERDNLDLEPLIEANLLSVVGIATEEEAASFIDFAAALDDGEAETCALAHHHGAIVATDDRKARRLCEQHDPPLTLRSTLDLIHQWSLINESVHDVVAEMLRDIRDRARFIPNRNDPLRPWWNAMLIQA
jgi:hypothetical protein